MPVTDIVSRPVRSRMMSGIRGSDTRPEMLIRRELHRRGFRYRLHVDTLPGKPDLVFPKYSAVLFVHGCFWHHHDCHLFKWPKTRPDFWQKKIEGNKQRDRRNRDTLTESGWRVARVWECAIKGKSRKPLDLIISQVASWLSGDSNELDIRGNE